jgi:hypothetical protein
MALMRLYWLASGHLWSGKAIRTGLRVMGRPVDGGDCSGGRGGFARVVGVMQYYVQTAGDLATRR